MGRERGLLLPGKEGRWKRKEKRISQRNRSKSSDQPGAGQSAPQWFLQTRRCRVSVVDLSMGSFPKPSDGPSILLHGWMERRPTWDDKGAVGGRHVTEPGVIGPRRGNAGAASDLQKKLGHILTPYTTESRRLGLFPTTGPPPSSPELRTKMQSPASSMCVTHEKHARR